MHLSMYIQRYIYCVHIHVHTSFLRRAVSQPQGLGVTLGEVQVHLSLCVSPPPIHIHTLTHTSKGAISGETSRDVFGY